jgi:hypothetical protein
MAKDAVIRSGNIENDHGREYFDKKGSNIRRALHLILPLRQLTERSFSGARMLKLAHGHRWQ